VAATVRSRADSQLAGPPRPNARDLTVAATRLVPATSRSQLQLRGGLRSCDQVVQRHRTGSRLLGLADAVKLVQNGNVKGPFPLGEILALPGAKGLQDVLRRNLVQRPRRSVAAFAIVRF